jgi:predicted Ser/Thr protein kinase
LKAIRLKFDSRKWKWIGSGGFGCYYRISKNRGVKFVGPSSIGRDLYNFGESSEGVLFRSHYWKKAKKEFDYLKKAQKSKVVPKVYGMAIVTYKNELYAGIVMQHIDSKTFVSSSREQLNKIADRIGDLNDVEQYLQRKLKAVGIYHDDLHGHNILITKGERPRVYAIDFSEERCGNV